MADNDPRKTRGQPAPPPDSAYPDDEDPLVELARIVSEDGGFYKPGRRADDQNTAREGELDAFSPELEAELLEELNTAGPRAHAGPDIAEPPAFADERGTDDDGYARPLHPEPAFDEPVADPFAAPRRDDAHLEPGGGQYAQYAEPDPYTAADRRPEFASAVGHGEPEPAVPHTGQAAGHDAYADPGEDDTDQDYGDTHATAGPEPDRPWLTEPATPVEIASGESVPAEAADGYYGDETEYETVDPYARSADSYGPETDIPDPAHQAAGDPAPGGEAAAYEVAGYDEAGGEQAQAYGYTDDPDAETSLADTLDPDFRQALDVSSDADEVLAPDDRDEGDYYSERPAAGAVAGVEVGEFAADEPHYADAGEEMAAYPAQEADHQLAMAEPEPDGFAETLGELAPDESVYEESLEKNQAGLTADRADYRGLDYAEPRKSRLGMFAIAAILAVLIIGGGLAATMGLIGGNGNADGAPPRIQADNSDVKQVPERIVADAGEDGTGQAVFDSVSGQIRKTEEKLIDNTEQPREVARVILPESGADTVSDGAGEGTKMEARIPEDAQLPETGPKFNPIGPRKVRTVIVKPDGTIVPNTGPAISAPGVTDPPAGDTGAPVLVQPGQAGDTTTADPMAAAGAAADSGQADPQPVKVRTIDVSSSTAPSSAPGNLPAERIVDAPNAATGGSEIAIAALESGTGGGETTGASGAGGVPKPRPDEVPRVRQPAPQQPAPQQPAVIRAAPEQPADRPVDLLASAPARSAPAAAPPVVRSGNAFVQLSSQRSAEQAQSTFRSLQRRYPNILSGYEPNIQRAEIAGKGIYYRVRVGPLANREAAGQLCNQIKASGGNCYVP